MKTVNPDELFQNLGEFLKGKGVELKEGPYTRRLRQGCGLLTDLVNTTHKTVTRARREADRTLDQLRQVIHEKTAPKPPAPAGTGRGKTPAPPAAAPDPSAAQTPPPTPAPAVRARRGKRRAAARTAPRKRRAGAGAPK